MKLVIVLNWYRCRELSLALRINSLLHPVLLV